MARDRQRAKQRKARRAQNPGPAPTEPHRANVPGELDHISGEVEEFEASLVAGANGEVPDADLDDDGAADAEFDRAAQAATGDLDDDGDIDEDDRALARTRGRSTARPQRAGGPRFLNFLKASWAELQRVQWPDRRQVGQATAVVLGFVIIAGAYLGISDQLAQKLVDLIL